MEDNGTIPQPLWCGELEVGELSQRINELCVDKQQSMCRLIEVSVE